MTITLTGRVPSKKKSRRAIYVHGRTIMIASKDYDAWHKAALEELEWKWPKRLVISAPKLISLVFFPPNKIRSDLTNKAESVCDLLVDAGIIPDDNWFVVPEIHLKLGGVDKANPRCEITIN